jgi:NitT/TauT family transport system substrate-binding protein
MKRRRFVLASLGAISFAGASLPAGAQTQTIRIGSAIADTFAEPFYAAEMGFYQKSGLTVETTGYSTGATVANAVASGTLDVGLSNVIQLGSAVEHGIPFLVVAPAAQSTPTYNPTELCVSKSSTIRTARDFEGKTIAVQSVKDMLAISVQAWLSQNGADLSQVKFVELTFSEMAPALERGTVAAAAISEPILSAAKATTARAVARPYGAVGARFYTGGWFTTKDWARRNPDLVKRLSAAIYETARWANAHHDESGAILAKRAKLDPDIVRKMPRAPYGESMDASLFQPPLDAAYKFKVFGRRVAAAELVTL